MPARVLRNTQLGVQPLLLLRALWVVRG